MYERSDYGFWFILKVNFNYCRGLSGPLTLLELNKDIVTDSTDNCDREFRNLRRKIVVKNAP